MTKRIADLSDPFVTAASTTPDSVMNESEWVRLETGSGSLMQGDIKEILLVFIRGASIIF